MAALRSPRKLFPVLVLTAVVTATAGCSSAEPADEWYTAPPVVGAPSADQVQPDDGAVAAGEWGAVRYMSTDDEETVLAVKTTALVVGEKGALGEVTVPGGDDLSEATPYYVSYSWANLTGDEDFSPSQNMVAGDPDAMTLSVPERFRGCEPAEGHEIGAGLGKEMRGCAVVASTSGPPTTLVFQGPQGSSTGVSFAVPTS